MLNRIKAIVAIHYFWLRETQWWVFASAVLLSVWGVVLAFPFTHTFASTPSYRTMAALMPEPLWAVLALIGATLGIMGIQYGDYRLQRASLMLGVFFWGSVGVCIMNANPPSTGGWVYLATSFLCSLAYMVRKE